MGLYGLSDRQLRNEFREAVVSYALTGHLPEHDPFWARLEHRRSLNPGRFDRHHPRIAYLFTPRVQLSPAASGVLAEELIIPKAHGPAPGTRSTRGTPLPAAPGVPLSATPEPSSLFIGVTFAATLGLTWGARRLFSARAGTGLPGES